MAKKTVVVSVTLENQVLQYIRDSFGVKSAIFTGTKGKSVTLTGWRADAVNAFLSENPMPTDYGIVADATSFTHEIKTKKGAAAGTGWTWLTFNGKVANEQTSQALKKLGFRYSQKRAAFYAQSEIAEKAVRKVVKL